MDFSYCKLEIFIPETHLEALQRALQEVDAGHIGNYDCCLSYSPVTGCWRSLAGTNPYLGSVGEISREPELKVEVTVRAERVDETIAAIKRAHPYEEPVINAIPRWRATRSFSKRRTTTRAISAKFGSCGSGWEDDGNRGEKRCWNYCFYNTRQFSGRIFRSRSLTADRSSR